MDPDMENIPTDYVNGTDFRLTKTTKGDGHADYTTSSWARRERSLDESELSAIDTYGLQDLSTFLPPRPTAEHYAVISEMFEASVDGELYDPAKWGNFYKPYGVEVPSNAVPSGAAQNVPASTTVAPVTEQAAPAPVAETPAPAPAEPAPQEAAAPAGEAKSAQDILDMIQSRKNQSEA
jgi:hypothetical protein